jgi:hypothetical protein
MTLLLAFPSPANDGMFISYHTGKVLTLDHCRAHSYHLYPDFQACDLAASRVNELLDMVQVTSINEDDLVSGDLQEYGYEADNPDLPVYPDD